MIAIASTVIFPLLAVAICECRSRKEAEYKRNIVERLSEYFSCLLYMLCVSYIALFFTRDDDATILFKVLHSREYAVKAACLELVLMVSYVWILFLLKRRVAGKKALHGEEASGEQGISPQTDRESDLRKILHLKADMRTLAIGAFLLLVVLAIPILRIMMYSNPWYDDFGYAYLTKVYWEMNHSYMEAIKGALENVRSTWWAWQGTYTSCFFMSLMPAVWGTDKYAYGLWAILFILIFSIFVFVKVLLKEVLKIEDRWICLFMQSVTAGTVILFMRSAVEGFFWYNSAVHYTAMHSLAILFLSALIKLIYAKGRVRTALLFVGSVIGAFVIGGVNNVTVLQAGIVSLSIFAVGLLFKKKRALLLLPALVSYGIAMYWNLASPGNAKRMVYFTETKLSPLEAILRSFQSAISYFGDFTGWMTLAILIFMLPVVWKLVSETKFEFKYPWLVLLWSFCLYATGFTPTLYTMGHTLLGRAVNMAKITFQLLLFINYVYISGWLRHTLKERKSVSLRLTPTWSYCVVLGMIMTFIFAVEPNKGGVYSSYCAYWFVHTGAAYNYHQEYLQRVEACDSPQMDITVQAYVYKPWVLCPGDLSEDPDYEPNQFMAKFFGKNSIVCVPRE